MSLGIRVLTPATTTILMKLLVKLSGITGATLNANKQIGGLLVQQLWGL